MSFSVDTQLLQRSLQTAHPGCAIEVRRFEGGQSIVEPGTNYTSEIVRARVDYECDGRPLRQALVFKIPFLSSHYEFIDEMGLYAKETFMYAEVLPRIRATLRSAVVPRHFLTTEQRVLVLEDLHAAGYYMLKDAALDYEHCACVLRAVAAFQGASVKLLRDDDRLLAPVSREAMCAPGLVRHAMAACYPALLGALRLERASATAVANFGAYEARINAGDICRLAGRRCRLNVLNHGDLKTNNMMFERDERGRPAAVKFLDYQTCRWNSPALDLIFFNMITMDYAVYEQSFDRLLELYLRALNDTLAETGCADCAYTAEDYRSDLEASKLFQVYVLVWIGFLDLREAIPGFDFDKVTLLNKDELEKVHKNESFQSRFMNWFRDFERRGFFD